MTDIRKNFKATSRLSKDQKKIQGKWSSKNDTNLQMKKNRSNSDSSSVVYDYLMMNDKRRVRRERESIGEVSTKRGFHRKVDAIRSGKENIETRIDKSTNMTNWYEISSEKLRKNKSAPKMSRHLV